MKTISIVCNSKRIFTKKNFYAVLVLLIAIAKIVRYTVLKDTLVDNGIGYKFLKLMQSESLKVDFFEGFSRAVDATGNAAWIYKKFNILGLNTYIQYEILITLIGNILFIFLIHVLITKMDEVRFVYLSILACALNIFDLCLSKEFIQILFFLLLAYLIRKYSKNEFLCVMLLSIGIIFMSVTFRIYFFLMLPFAGYALIIYKLYLKNRKFLQALIILLAGAGFLYMLCLLFARQISGSGYAELIRVRNRMVPSKTRIVPSIAGAHNLVQHTVNYLTVIFRLLFPVEIVFMGIQYMLYFFCQIIITYMFLKAFAFAKRGDTVSQFSIVIFTGFLLMSAVHEIEFGSWIRHEVAIFPILIMFRQK